MGRRTIRIADEVYERLSARIRADESFTDCIDRLRSEARPDWREGVGTLSVDDAAGLRASAEDSRAALRRGLGGRRTAALEVMTEAEGSDEAP